MRKIPSFCTRLDCEYHENPPKDWFIQAGSYETRAFGTVQRYRCKKCHKYCSDQTFKVSYYLQKDIPLWDIFQQLNDCSGIRDLSRKFKISTAAICNRIGRMARQFIGMNAQLLEDFHLQEDLVTDGFESFTQSQYYPNNYHLLAGKDSQMIYALDYAILRRKGQMTKGQKKHREELEKVYKPSPREVKYSFERLCKTMSQLIQSSKMKTLTIYSDQKQEYQQVLKQLKSEYERDHLPVQFEHETISSKAARTSKNPLFSVNYLDREFRKDQANHGRKTVQFSRDANNAMERMVVYAAYHNYRKKWRINLKDPRTHAEVAGYPKRKIQKLMKTVFTRRYFLSKTEINPSTWRLWFRLFITPGKGVGTNRPKHFRSQ